MHCQFKGTACWYQSRAIMCYFTASEIINKHDLTRIYEIYNKQWQKDCAKRGIKNTVILKVW